MRAVVVGATGRIGHAVLRELLQGPRIDGAPQQALENEDIARPGSAAPASGKG